MLFIYVRLFHYCYFRSLCWWAAGGKGQGNRVTEGSQSVHKRLLRTFGVCGAFGDE